MIGARLSRVEDERFLRGEGRFVADLRLPFMLEAFVLRSPHAHARIARIDAAAALARGVVETIVTACDLPPGLPAIPCRIPTHGDMTPFLQPVLAREMVRYVGEPVAVIVASSRALAEDAAELIVIDWEPLLPVPDAAAALRPESSRLFPSGNIASHWSFDLGDVRKALAEAAVSVSERFEIQRHSAVPLETRGLLAQYDRARHLLEVHGPTKVPHTNRALLAHMLGLSQADIRFIEPDVGGSFGARGEFYPEDFLVPWLAMRLACPVRWIEDRLEHFAAINHSRESSFEVTGAADAEGRITAFDVRLIADLGAYIRTHGDVVPSHAAASFPGPYRVRNYRVDAAAVLSNKTPSGTMRAPGMFESNFARERIVDLLARELGIDPAEMRRRNLIGPEEMPWVLGTESVKRPTIFDNGDYPSVFEKALSGFGWSADPQPGRGTLLRSQGLATLVEPSAFGPFESARIEVDPEGFVNVVTGASSHGQGHETVLAQIAADVLGVSIERIRVRHGDTGLIQFGGGSYASRSAVMAGNTVYQAALAIRTKALRVASQLLQVGEAELRLAAGRISMTGRPDTFVTLASIARMLGPGNTELLASPATGMIEDNEGLIATSFMRGVPSGTSVFSVHMAEVAVDAETGEVTLERYCIAADVGRAINPSIVEGQLVGGVVQGIGGTLLEKLDYDESGQLLTGSFADYLLPSVHDAPRIEALVLEQVRSPSNALGVKGVGEVGTSGVAAAIGNAVARAVGRPTRISCLPLTPERVLAAIMGSGVP
jgi:carbon-monoxide dehydrogenase large subunit/6-hydroxypseudooxynicotine dehydrogenase subunit gamma